MNKEKETNAQELLLSAVSDLPTDSSAKRSEDELNKARKMQLIKIGSIMMFASIVMIMLTIAWFSSNKNVPSKGGEVRAATPPFELRTEGYKGYSDNYLPSGDDGYLKLGEDTEGVLTTAEGQKIEWLVTKDYNAKNYYDNEDPDFDDDKNIGIRPGDHGVLRFWIVPKDQQTMNFSFNLKVTPYRKQYPNDDNGKPNYDATPTPILLTESDSELASFVDCHILFFRYKGNDPAFNEKVTEGEGDEAVTETKNTNDKYSKLIDDNFTEKITFTRNSDGQLEPYEIDVYWIWPETLSEAVLEDTDKRTAICKTINGTNEILNKLNEDPQGFLMGYEGSESLSQADITSNYASLSIKYNNADQEIGDNIMHLLAEMTVTISD